MVVLQRKLGENKGIVMDGRDIGTVVFPHADLKIFMTADPEIRAQRRFKELIQKGLTITMEEVRENIARRDYMDQHRKVSPLKKAEDAIVFDNSFLTLPQQLNWAIEIVESISRLHEN
jgi:cytidylate kinase